MRRRRLCQPVFRVPLPYFEVLFRCVGCIHFLCGLQRTQQAEDGSEDLQRGKQTSSDAAAAWRTIQEKMKPPKCRGHNEECVIRQVKKKGPNFGEGLNSLISIQHSAGEQYLESVWRGAPSQERWRGKARIAACWLQGVCSMSAEELMVLRRRAAVTSLCGREAERCAAHRPNSQVAAGVRWPSILCRTATQTHQEAFCVWAYLRHG